MILIRPEGYKKSQLEVQKDFISNFKLFEMGPSDDSWKIMISYTLLGMPPDKVLIFLLSIFEL